MRLERFYDDDLAQASYLIGCEATGEALVVDPNLETRQYVDAAARHGLRITTVTETHIHADFLSGARALAAATGATLALSAAGPAEWQYRFEAPNRRRLFDGDRIAIGRIEVEVLHTPGHTPEHIALLVADTARGGAPLGLCSGDFVFVGDIGRPDLLERAANMAGTMAEGARQMFHSLRRFVALPDYVQVWPGHGAGSACGKALGAMPQSTVGYERLFNWALQVEVEAAFVEAILAGQPEPPRYFARMKTLNRDAQPVSGEPPVLARVDGDALLAHRRAGGAVLDTRAPADFQAGHLPGSVNVPLRRGFSGWAGSILPGDPPLLLVADAEAAVAAAHHLRLIGFSCCVGYTPPETLDDLERAGVPLATMPRFAPNAAFERWQADQALLLDVRGRTEFAGGHLPGAVNLPLPEIAARLAEVPADRPVIVHCQGGNRSAVAASYLAAHGRANLADMSGGYAEWQSLHLPTEP